MDLTPYVDHVRRELVVAAEASGEEAGALAERLWSALDSVTRLTLLEALSDAADEITAELAPGSVEVRLRGRDPEFVVSTPAPPASTASPADLPVEDAPPAAPLDDEEGGTTRLTLRLPHHLKPGIDEAAGRAGLSVNAWLVRAVAAALQPAARGPGDAHRGAPFGQRYSGWVR
jgi:hypothetical protein